MGTGPETRRDGTVTQTEKTPTSEDDRFATAAEIARCVREGTTSARQVIEKTLDAIATVDPHLNAFSAILTDEALAEADSRDADQSSGRPLGPLHGVPIAIKDENHVKGVVTGYGGGAFVTPAAADSEVVRRLREAGAVIVGKTRMPEFGIWPFTETSANGWTRNPWNPLHSTAGSSGGSAAAVASGAVPVAIGGDGGGSIRLPSSWCGLFGLKCQRGRTSAAPNRNLWRSLGVIGPLARTVADSALVYDAITGSTDIDQWKANPLPLTLTEALTRDPGRLRIAVSARNPTGGPKADAQTLAALHRTADALGVLGHDVIEADPAYPRLGITFAAQVAAGVTEEAARAERPDLLEARTRGVVSLARPLVRFADKAEQHAAELSKQFDETFFGGFDLLLTPTTPFPAPALGQLDGCGAIAALRRAEPVASFTGIWNVLGNPAAAIPAGFSSDGLPLSVQLIGPTDGEPRIVQVASQLEEARADTDRIPVVHA